MAQPIKQVILKVFLYSLDVLSDWVNGAEQIIGMDIYKGQKSQPNCSEITMVNVSSLQPDFQSRIEGSTLGVITIGLSWLPGVIGILFYKSLQTSPKPLNIYQLCILTARFCVWPLYVPLQILVGGVWPDSKFGGCFIFPKKNEYHIDSYALGIYYKTLEGLIEAAPQLTIQTISILQNLNPTVFQIVSMAISALTLTLTNIEVYFQVQDTARRMSWLELLKRNILVTPYFLINSVFKILSMGLIFAIFNLWGLMILMLWSVVYTFLVAYLHDQPIFVPSNLFGLGPGNAFFLHPGTLPSSKEGCLLMPTPQIRYKAIMRISVWVNFVFNTVWFGYGLAFKCYMKGKPYPGPSKDVGITLDYVHGDYLFLIMSVIWSIGLISCLIVEIYLSQFPDLLGLNKWDDYCSTIDIPSKSLDNFHDIKDNATEAVDALDTCMESSELFQVE